MFETSLTASRRTALRPRNWRLFPLALFLHLAVLAGVVMAQVWGVEEIAPPPDHLLFFVSLPPPMPPGPPKSPTPRQPVAPRSGVPAPQVPQDAPPVQPTPPSDSSPVPDADPPAPPPTGGVETTDGPGGPGDGPGVPGSVSEAADSILRIDSDITPPELLTRATPVYNEAARIGRIEGTVLLEAVIDMQGNVSQVRVLRSLPLGLDAKAVEAVRQWKYRPARRHGQAVAVYLYVTVEYRLR